VEAESTEQFFETRMVAGLRNSFYSELPLLLPPDELRFDVFNTWRKGNVQLPSAHLVWQKQTSRRDQYAV